MNMRAAIPKAAFLAHVPHNAPLCPSCDAPARLTDGREIYPHRADLADKRVWKCDPCGGYVGCHPGGTEPLGTPAGPALRRARMELHHERIDPLWKAAHLNYPNPPTKKQSVGQINRVARSRVYQFLADRMGIDGADCHTGMFTLEQCRAARRALDGVTYPYASRAEFIEAVLEGM